MSNDANVSKRDGFRSRGGFIIACIGSAVGMGNIWRFPTLVSKWGGMTFLLPYFLFVILIGSTGVIGEFALGRAAGAGPVDAFGMCTETRWGKRRPGELVGYIPVLGSLALAIGYTCVMGWIFKYTFLAFDGGLSATGQDMDGIVATFNATASAWGANVWVVVAVAVSFVIMSFGIAGGIEKANKIMMPILFLLFVGLGIYVGTLPGASDGYRYIFTIKPAGLLDPYVWIYAFGQAFFSLSVAGNGSVIYGSYLSKSECIPSSARNVALFDTIAALLAAFAAGVLTGLVTGLLHTKLGIPAILAGILTQFSLYSINLRIMTKANQTASIKKFGMFWEGPKGFLLSSLYVPQAIAVGFVLAVVAICLLYWYFGTEQGSAIRATGANPSMSRAQGININAMKVLGLSLSNGMVALSGGLMAQYQGFADINMGRGAIVIGLAAVIIGEVLCDAFFRKGCNFSVRLSFVILGGIVYYLVMVLILWLKLDPNDLKLFTAVIVAAFLAVPYLKGQAKSSFHRLKKGDK